MSKASDIVWGFVAGAALGVVGGMLFAPERGSVTRRKITDGAKGMYNGGRNRLHAIGDAFSEGKRTYLREANHVK